MRATDAAPLLTAREIAPTDVGPIADYWAESPQDHLLRMGVDLDLLPTRAELVDMLERQLARPVHERQSFATIWEADDVPVGHCNVNRIIVGREAFMHLHLWRPEHRRRGWGARLIRRSLPIFFDRLGLADLYCEPYAENPAPHRALAKAGFEFVAEHVTVPGAINFPQRVFRWHLSRERLIALHD